ncbi:hypothetical protein Dimus_025691 [Dionaea muscipula]
MHIVECDKLSYIRGTPPSPKPTDDGYDKWYSENQRVKRWLLMSMKPDIMKRYICLTTTVKICVSLGKAFSDGADELQVFALHQRAFSARQGGRPLSVYYGDLTVIFSELDHRDKVSMEHPNDVTSYRKSVQRQRVHIFLAGLDGEFEQLRGEILRKDPIPELEEAYSLVRREDLRRTTMNADHRTMDSTVMATRSHIGGSNHSKGLPSSWPSGSISSSSPLTNGSASGQCSSARRSSRPICSNCQDPVTSARNAMTLWGFPHGGTTPVLGNPSLQQRPWSVRRVFSIAICVCFYGRKRNQISFSGPGQTGNNDDGNGCCVGLEETRTSESPGTSDGGGSM